MCPAACPIYTSQLMFLSQPEVAFDGLQLLDTIDSRELPGIDSQPSLALLDLDLPDLDEFLKDSPPPDFDFDLDSSVAPSGASTKQCYNPVSIPFQVCAAGFECMPAFKSSSGQERSSSELVRQLTSAFV